MSKKRLPFAMDVELATYQTPAYTLGIIKANVSNYSCWLSNNYVNCVFITAFNLCNGDGWAIREGVLEKSSYQYSKEEMLCDNKYIINNTRDLLNKNCYVYGLINEKYIPGKKHYKEKDYIHSYLLIGYDDEKEVFLSVGYSEKGRYCECEIAYKDYYIGLQESNDGGNVVIDCYKVIRSYVNDIDIDVIRSKLICYLESENHPDDYFPEGLYGINVWELLYLRIKYWDKEEISIKYGRVYMEHKYIMYIRIKYLYERGYFDDEKLCASYFESIYIKSQIVYNLFLKYDMTKKRELLERAAEIIKETNDTEKKYIKEFIAKLQ